MKKIILVLLGATCLLSGCGSSSSGIYSALDSVDSVTTYDNGELIYLEGSEVKEVIDMIKETDESEYREGDEHDIPSGTAQMYVLHVDESEPYFMVYYEIESTGYEYIITGAKGSGSNFDSKDNIIGETTDQYGYLQPVYGNFVQDKIYVND